MILSQDESELCAAQRLRRDLASAIKATQRHAAGRQRRLLLVRSAANHPWQVDRGYVRMGVVVGYGLLWVGSVPGR
jgi:hypothetical protein